MDAEYKIYQAFLDAKAKQLYFNQIKDITKLSNSSLQNVLNRLEIEKIIGLNKTKANVFYEIKNKKQFALKFSEIALKKFNSLNRGIKMPLQNLLDKMDDSIFTIVLFGSASRNEETTNSDIDLLIVAKSQNNYDIIKTEIDSISNYPLNLFKCNIKQFKDGKDHIVIQAKETGFPIKGEQNFYEAIINEY